MDRTKTEQFMKKEMDEYEKKMIELMKKSAKLIPINNKTLFMPFADTNYDALGVRDDIIKNLTKKLKDVKNVKDLDEA